MQTGRLRRSILVSLRWMAVLGQLATLLIVWLWFGFKLPIFACLVFIGVSAALNTAIIWQAPLDRRVSDIEAGTQLFFDLLQLAALLYLTGGIKNPFAILLLAPVVVAAKTLNLKVLFGLTITVVILSILLLFYHLPLPWFDGQVLQLPQFYLYGTWFALIVGMLFTSFYTWTATAQTRRMTEAFSASEAILSHERKLAALGGLAAAAAHELGTPLATIQVVAKEIAREAKNRPELEEDAKLLLSQANRCRDILKQLGLRGDTGDGVLDWLDLQSLISEITEPFINVGININTRLSPPNEAADIPVFKRHQELVYGLTNIVENAVDFAKSEIDVVGTWNEDTVTLEISDDGPGFDNSIFSKLGEPYISRRSQSKKKTGGGMGLGVFIAKTLIERLGGVVAFKNRKRGEGALVHLSWPYILST